MVGGKTGQLFGTEQQDHIIMLSIQHRDRAADIALNFLSRHHHQLVITEQGQESFLAVTYGVLGHYLVRRHLAQQADVGDLFFLICSVRSGNTPASGTTPMVKIAIVALLISCTFSQPLLQHRLSTHSIRPR